MFLHSSRKLARPRVATGIRGQYRWQEARGRATFSSVTGLLITYIKFKIISHCKCSPRHCRSDVNRPLERVTYLYLLPTLIAG